MKIAIDTIVDYGNYGNRLQNYALQQVLIGLGHDVTTLKNIPSRSLLVKIKDALGSGELFRKVLKKISFTPLNGKDEVRSERFIDFSHKFISETQYYINQKTNDFSFDKEFDCYVIGSDQVWNYTFGRILRLDFVEYSRKPKISYAASFGVASIPSELVPQYRQGLNSIDYLSVRENAGKSIIETVCGRTADVVLDPTLLLERDSWDCLTVGAKKYKEKYVLTYFLDTVNSDDWDYILAFAKRRGLIIKSLNSSEDDELWDAGPIEFLNLFKQASAIFTDSFHACVFSMIFEKYFEVFERNNVGPSMSSRIDTLLTKVGLSNQWHSNEIKNNEVDYKKVNECLYRERQESLDFLRTSLNNVERKCIEM